MDGTLGDYMKIPIPQIQTHIIDFIEKNKTDCLLTLLWHNTEFSEYSFKAYLSIYKSILRYLKENRMEVTTVKKVLEAARYWGGQTLTYYILLNFFVDKVIVHVCEKIILDAWIILWTLFKKV